MVFSVWERSGRHSSRRQRGDGGARRAAGSSRRRSSAALLGAARAGCTATSGAASSLELQQPRRVAPQPGFENVRLIGSACISSYSC